MLVFTIILKFKRVKKMLKMRERNNVSDIIMSEHLK